MIQYAPYIIAFITQTVLFCVWIVKSNSSFDKKITLMEEKIKNLKEQASEAKQETRDQNKWIQEQMQKVSHLLSDAKVTIDHLLLKEMKTKKA